MLLKKNKVNKENNKNRKNNNRKNKTHKLQYSDFKFNALKQEKIKNEIYMTLYFEMN
jgi:hypothetical protein